MNTGVVRNAGISVGIVVVSVFVASVATRFLVAAQLTQFLKDIWIVQAVLVTAVVSLIYRLQSDLAGKAGLTAAQRVKLDGMVKLKARRLWILFFAIALAALLPRVAEVVALTNGSRWLVFSSVMLSSATALYCGYLPGMWNELRRFLTDLVAERERRERQQLELARLDRNRASD